MPTGTTLRRAPAALASSLLLAAAGAGCGDEETEPSDQPAPPAAESAGGAEHEAAPEAAPAGAGSVEELPPDDEAAVRAAVEAYVEALNAHDGAAVCELAAPGGIPPGELPVRAPGCAASLEASIGHRGGGGTPAWRRTRIVEVTAVSLGDERARVTATVVHRFADRGYRSVEEDVIHLDHVDGRWLLAKPSATLYRAVGYPEPPLRAFTEPPR